jgi:predicted DNA-binding transcriptional regulator YafY
MPPLLLDDDESIAIAIGLRTAASNPVAGIEDASLRALAKLEQVLPIRLRKRVSALGAAVLPFPGYGGPQRAGVDAVTLSIVARAIADRARLRFRYEAFHRTASRRTVEPERLVANGRTWYLVAWDVDREDWRIFRVDRIEDAWSVPGRFVRHDLPAPDAAAYVASRLSELAPTYRASATLHAPIEEARQLLADGIGHLEPIDQQRCRVTIETDTIEWLAFRLTSLGIEFEVHAPPELVDHLRAIGGRALRAASP